ncbi:non-ribosomal peptide synthetase [Fluviispira multicolorata]|uniref:Amino acid adenylation domain-containing protein n=1 Tax=Fluviispira multicolorata TaxID=2654512 RepID=A0A833JCK0_9BACT|nr:non-ribosomal peptide synthetase [Fluviispira multicolorata]KAB8030776.1 amino acid adenylation domain-containing protein [Fluviispira multicolorata]
MQIINNWEKNSTVRNKPRRILISDGSKYFFPITEQPLCLHPIIMALGEEITRSILVQSAYMFMQNILINETEVVCKIVQKIIQKKPFISLPEEMYQNLLTVIIDESYHAHVAHDFINQVENFTKIKPIALSFESSLTRSIQLVLTTLPEHCRFYFEIIAVCIAENSITKELVATIKDPEVNIFFNEINADHLADEGRHCGIFSELLTRLWQEISEDTKKIIGRCLPNFICEYLSRDIKIKIDRDILSKLNLECEEIERVLYDTHPEYTVESLWLINPIVKNIISVLKKSGILNHPETAQAFQKIGYAEYKNLFQNEMLQQAKKCEAEAFKKVNTGNLNFLRCAEQTLLPAQQLHHFILLNVDITANVCREFILSYIYDVMNDSSEENSANEFLDRNCIWLQKIPICITASESFVTESNRPEILQLHIFPKGTKHLQISAHYNSKYYDAKRIEEFLENVSYYLTTALNNPTYHSKNLPLVSLKQRELFLKQAKENSIDTNNKETIISLFVKQVANHPQHIAVTSEFKSITYQQLDHLSDIVAYNLQKSGLNCGSIIAVIHEHTYVYIPIIFGIMKAKMVFLPLSPQETQSRLQSILHEAEVSFVITDVESLSHILTDFTCLLSSQIIHSTLENISTHFSRYKMQLTANELAYIIYTSGSSGLPKGVMIAHGALVCFAKSAAKTFPITKEDRILQFCSYNFDASLADICASLISGASICLRTQNILNTSAHFFEICQQYKITILNLPATLWGQLVHDLFAFSLKLPDSLKTVVIGGESLAPAILEQWFQFKPSGIRLLNTYGPTEATIAVTACELDNYVAFYAREKLIGQPFTHALLYVLDDYYRLVPIGVSGELYIGGLGVSRGYFKRPNLTAKSFLQDLNTMNKDLPKTGPVYKTGDRVRWVNENTLEFLGRSDRQIKIRGFRIELSEIECVLNKHALVASSIAIYNQNALIPYIAAFVLPNISEINAKIKIEYSTLKTSIQDHIKQNLPEYMQPARLQFVEKWPVTIQGKIDTNQLIDLLSTEKKPQSKNNSESQCNEKKSLELVLANLWKKLLGVQEINAESHFFYLGGHSLHAMRLLALINREIQSQLTVREILENPNFSCMLNVIQQSIGGKRSIEQIQSGSFFGPLSFVQEGLWILNYLQSEKSINYNVAYALHLKGVLDTVTLEESVNRIIERQWILRSIFKRDTNITQNVLPISHVILKPEIITIEQFREFAVINARTPFHLSNNPPLTLRLFQIHSEHFILFVNHHHIIHDASSINIFIKELSTIYESILTKVEYKLPKILRQYVDYALWQRSPKNIEATKSLDYWCHQLKNYKPICLPFRKSNVHLNSSSGHTYYFSIDESITQKLRNICSHHDCTLFVGLLTIMNLLLHRYSGENDIAFASVISTRDHHIDEHLMGMFLNVVLLRNKIYVGDSFVDLLTPIKKTLFDATIHRFTPLELINQSMHLQRLAFCHTLVDISVNFHHFDENFAKFVSQNMNSEIEFIDNKTAKFGLSFDIYVRKKSLDIKIEYCTDLYDLSSIEKFSEEFLFLTKSVIEI